MTKRTITIIIALVAVIGLTAGYFGVQAYFRANPRRLGDFDFSNLPPSPRLTEFNSQRLSRIENITEGFALVRDGNIWSLEAEDLPVESIRINNSLINNRLWSLSSIWAENIIEEEPEDLAVYGLDNPVGRVLVGDMDGTTVEFIFGNLTPSRSSFYIMVAGSPAVYTLSTFSSDLLLFSLDSVRDKSLAAYLNP